MRVRQQLLKAPQIPLKAKLYQMLQIQQKGRNQAELPAVRYGGLIRARQTKTWTRFGSVLKIA